MPIHPPLIADFKPPRGKRRLPEQGERRAEVAAVDASEGMFQSGHDHFCCNRGWEQSAVKQVDGFSRVGMFEPVGVSDP